MPKTKRLLLKRQISFAYEDLERVIEHLAAVGLEFKEVHPELLEGLEVVTLSCLEAQKVLARWVEAVWGNSDPDWVSWRNAPKVDRINPDE